MGGNYQACWLLKLPGWGGRLYTVFERRLCIRLSVPTLACSAGSGQIRYIPILPTECLESWVPSFCNGGSLSILLPPRSPGWWWQDLMIQLCPGRTLNHPMVPLQWLLPLRCFQQQTTRRRYGQVWWVDTQSILTFNLCNRHNGWLGFEMWNRLRNPTFEYTLL